MFYSYSTQTRITRETKEDSQWIPSAEWRRLYTERIEACDVRYLPQPRPGTWFDHARLLFAAFCLVDNKVQTIIRNRYEKESFSLFIDEREEELYKTYTRVKERETQTLKEIHQRKGSGKR